VKRDNGDARRTPETDPSKRDFLKTSAGLLASAAFAPLLPGSAAPQQDNQDARTVERIERQNREARGRILVKGGTVVTMDPAVGDFLQADVLIDGKKIVEVRPNIRASGTVIDATNMIVMPGLVDGHRHCWQNMFRRVICNADGEVYGTFANSLIPAVRPRDVYIGNLASGLSAINAGITSMLDVSHISKTSAHSDAAITAHLDSGIRAVYGYAAPRGGAAQATQYPQDIHRIKKQFFSSEDQLVSLRLAGGDVALARQVGVGITMDGIFGMATPLRPNSAEQRLLQMAKAGELGPDLTLIHGTGFSESVFKAIADNGVSMVLAVTSDGTLRGLGNSVAPIQGVIDHGLLQRTGLSVDVEVCLSPDLFAQMRAVFLLQRVLSNKRWAEGDPTAPAPMTVRDVLTMATVGGARASGLQNKIGTLTPGKEADIVLIRANDINTGPLNNAIGTIVIGAGTDNVDTVIIAGQIRKTQGKLVGVNEAAVMRAAKASRDYLAAATGLWKTADILG
jgi:cytosine/adenosine deaminase-related metal-dependent hydrolase